ncbi:MAG: hypothetical protein HY754_02310, partial [Nitrospirae bacterium]|nr:hypothetical protein [Nitrospirota bacterium]
LHRHLSPCNRDWKDNPISRAINVNRSISELKPLQDWNAAYELKTKTVFLSPNETKEIPITITNTGKELWPNTGDSNGKYVVHLSYHIANSQGKTVCFDGNRAKLDKNINPGDSIGLMLPVTAPKLPGRYIIKISLVQEGVAWFDEKGVPPITAELVVR